MKLLDKIERPKPVSELVRDQLRADIISGRLELGAKISENHLSELYGVTKAPIRSAFIRLEAEGLLEIRAQVGTFVFSPAEEEVRALCELRTALELEALALAADRNFAELLRETELICGAMRNALTHGELATYQELDTALHLTIVRCANSPMLGEAYASGISGRFAALRTRFGARADHVAASSTEHYEICEAIAAGKIDHAQLMLREHIGHTRDYFARLLKGH